ncbi:MAG: hypothetical protein CMP65_05090 [Flavobacteriales bacterium]|nr:hypothetical protein [Flavobacteriales bacterium]
MSIYLKILFIFLINNTLLFSQSYKNNWYKIIEKIGDVEIRQYNDLILATYQNDNSNRSESFRNLASYIFGNNNKNENIGMTSPVIVDLVGVETMHFIMPSDYQIETMPDPNNDKILLRDVLKCKKAVISYSGFTNKSTETKKINKLKLILSERGVSHKNDFQVLVYDSPYKFFNRRNEICVTIK